jgi:hypothetical protein
MRRFLEIGRPAPIARCATAQTPALLHSHPRVAAKDQTGNQLNAVCVGLIAFIVASRRQFVHAFAVLPIWMLQK